jgi:two-component system phosphate regulon sensor histidine kinase PhoR
VGSFRAEDRRAGAFAGTALLVSGALFAALLLRPLLNTRSILALLVAALTGALAGRLLFKPRGSDSDAVGLGSLDGEGDPGAAATLKRLFVLTLSGMREGVLVIDRDMRVVVSNDAARNLFAYHTGPLDSRLLNDVTQNKAIYSAFLDALRGKERSGIKVETYGAERRVYDLRAAPLKLGGRDETQGAIGVFFDITRLERLERVRQEFLSNVSHELRTPLTSIRAFAETLEDGAIDDPENNRRFVDIIGKNATRMQSLVDDILELGAIEAGNVAIEPSTVQLRTLVAEVFASLARRAEARGVTLVNEVGEGAHVYADSRRLEQMLTNLVDNAVKFNRDGGTVWVRHTSAAHDEIQVIDTGEGVPSEHIERLFERFYRVDKARSRELGGTGLGLAIVKHLARAHEGEVNVQSRFGEGTTFTIRLPARAPEGKGRFNSPDE